MRLRCVLIDKPYDRRTARIAGIGYFQVRNVAFLPVSEHRAQQGDHLGLLEIARHSENDTVGMNGSPVKRDEIVTAHSLDRFHRAFTSAGMLRPIELLEEFPANNRSRAVLTSRYPFDRLELGQLKTGGFERRLAQKPGEDLEPAVKIFGQNVQRGRPGLPSHRYIDIDRKLLEFLIDMLGGPAPAAPGSHDGTGQRGQPNFIRRPRPTSPRAHRR